MSFFSIPPEIRVRIYKTLFGSRVRQVVYTQSLERVSGGTQKFVAVQREPRSGQLLRVCRSVQQEAMPVLMDNTVLLMQGESYPTSLQSDRFYLRLDSHNLQHVELFFTAKPAEKEALCKQIGALVSLPALQSLVVHLSQLAWSRADIMNNSDIKPSWSFEEAFEEVGAIMSYWLFKSKLDRLVDYSDGCSISMILLKGRSTQDKKVSASMKGFMRRYLNNVGANGGTEESLNETSPHVAARLQIRTSEGTSDRTFTHVSPAAVSKNKQGHKICM